MARLRIEFRGSATVVSLKHGATTVGRSNRCTIALPDPTLAEIHFRIEERSRGYRLKDDGSGSGTRVNGKTVFATTLQDGDVIEAGALRCEFLSEVAAAPAPREPRPQPEHEAAPAAMNGLAERAARPVARRDRTGLLVGVAVVVVAAAIGIYLWRDNVAEKEAARLYREAVDWMTQARDEPARADELLEKSAAQLERLRREYPSSRVAGTAEISLAEARRIRTTIEAVEDVGRSIAANPTDAQLDEAWRKLASLRDVAHPAIESAAMAVDASIRAARVSRLDAQYDSAAAKAEQLAGNRQFGPALAVWDDFTIADFAYRRRAAEAREALARRIDDEYRGVLRLAARNDDIDGRIGLLEASRDTFRGTRQAEDLEVRISALRARRDRQALVLEGATPEPATPTPEEGTERPPTPEEAGPYEEPAKVGELVRARRYGEAAALLHSISRHPLAAVRGEELTLLATTLADLGAAIQADPSQFDQVLLPGGGRADATGADTSGITVGTDEGPRTIAWSELSCKAFPRLFRQAGLDKPPRLGVALFFAEEGEEDEARRRLVDVFESGGDRAALTRILALRRGIPPPPDGFVVFHDDLVTPAQQERALLLERVEKLAREARIATDRRRVEIWDELERLGEPALEPLIASVKARREEVASGLKDSKAFRTSTWVARFGSELRRRREYALAFIMDPAAYPYPNKTAEAQAEAEKRVDAVREVYEQPYPLLLEASKEAQALDGELGALDERLARIDPLGEPVREGVIAEIVARLDVRNGALDDQDRKRIEYNRQVLEYNRTLEGTTVDDEERANVAAVNEYRWMMGLHCVKIDERLVRCARKHSIEMEQLDYFEHDSPTPQLKTPTLRARREGYGGGVSENIARGASTGVQAFWQWYKSSGHHRNMLMPGHTDLGCGSARHHWWTQNFGSATGRSLDPPRVPPDPDPPGQSGNGMPAPAES